MGNTDIQSLNATGHEAPIPLINRLIHDDCLNAMKTMPSSSIGLIVTDPPYLVRYQSRDGRRIENDDNDRWLEPAFTEAYRVLRPDSFCVSFYGWHQIDRFMTAWRTAGFRPVGHFVCTKRYASGQGFTKRHHENAYLLAKGRPSEPSHPPSDILPWSYTGNKLHPTQKPIETILPLIESYSSPGDIVLDPFAGSATTAVAAYRLGRSYIAIEKDAPYYEKARHRLKTLCHP